MSRAPERTGSFLPKNGHGTTDHHMKGQAQPVPRRVLRAGGLGIALACLAAVLLSGCGGKERSHTESSRATRTSTAQQHTTPTTAYSPAPKGGHGTLRAPILMYHVINPPPSGAPFPGLYVTPGEFAAQMRALAKAGYHAVTMDQLLSYWQHGTPLPQGKPIVLSFDNGYQSQYTQALPVLRQLGWVGVENIQLTGLPPSQGGLSQSQIQGLITAGWELDTQGISHADLIKLTPTELHEQVAASRETIQRRYHVPVRWFCYPSGHYDPTVVAAVSAAGYVGSTTVVPGWAGPTSDLYRLPRLRVLGGTSPQGLLQLISATATDGTPPVSYGSG